MTRRRMDNLYKALESIGLRFEECNCDTMKRFQGWNADMISVGILRDVYGFVITDTQMKEILDIAKKKKTYILIQPGKKEFEINGNAANGTIRLNENDVAVCFIQAGIIEMFKHAETHVITSLKRNFLYFQEDEHALELERKLNLMTSNLSEFELFAYELSMLRAKSFGFRRSLAREGAVFTHNNEMIYYMDGYAEQKHAETMCFAGQCLRLMCA